MIRNAIRYASPTRAKFDFSRKAPVAAAISLAILASQASLAGEAQAPQESLEEITVTGSRIQQATGMSTPTPVAALSATELMAMAPASVTAALTQLPQFSGPSSTSESFSAVGFFASPGGGSLNLRGLDSKRTLTLLDSRRVVPSSAFGGPDINLFPEQVLLRIEAVTGGASAAYGTDAVSGVVNYILDTEFDGFRASAQTGFSERGDGRSQKYSMAFGSDLGERTHVLFSAGYTERDDIVGYDGRDWYNGCGLTQNPSVPANVALVAGSSPPQINASTFVPANGGYSADNPRLLPTCNLHNTQLTYDGLVTFGSGATARQYELMSDGSAIPFNRTVPRTGPNAGVGVMPGGGGQNLAETDTSLLSGWNLKNAFLYLDHDITDNVNVYVQGMYAEQTLRAFSRVGDIGNAPPQNFTIFRDNAFLPASLAAIMDQEAVTSVAMTRAGNREDWGTGYYDNTNVMSAATLGFKSTLLDRRLPGWLAGRRLRPVRRQPAGCGAGRRPAPRPRLPVHRCSAREQWQHPVPREYHHAGPRARLRATQCVRPWQCQRGRDRLDQGLRRRHCRHDQSVPRLRRQRRGGLWRSVQLHRRRGQAPPRDHRADGVRVEHQRRALRWLGGRGVHGARRALPRGEH